MHVEILVIGIGIAKVHAEGSQTTPTQHSHHFILENDFTFF